MVQRAFTNGLSKRQIVVETLADNCLGHLGRYCGGQCLCFVLMLSGGYKNYQNGAGSNQLTDNGRGMKANL
jgi:hypothetical protein